MCKMIKTTRLVLRPWKEADLEAFAKLNADAKVMEHFPATLTKEESDALAAKIRAKFDQKGWGLFAVSIPGAADFIGFIGLAEPSFEAHFTPAVEIGWRLAPQYWGKGYATEGALAVLKYGFEVLGLKEIVSFTAVQNKRSRAVMERIGMHRDQKDDFDHPKLPDGHRIKKHVLYRIGVADYFCNNQPGNVR